MVQESSLDADDAPAQVIPQAAPQAAPRASSRRPPAQVQVPTPAVVEAAPPSAAQPRSAPAQVAPSRNPMLV